MNNTGGQCADFFLFLRMIYCTCNQNKVLLCQFVTASISPFSDEIYKSFFLLKKLKLIGMTVLILRLGLICSS